jgi:hypothetical protein
VKIALAVCATILVIAGGIGYVAAAIFFLLVFWPGLIILILIFWGMGKPIAEALGAIWARALIKPPQPLSEYDRKWNRELGK